MSDYVDVDIFSSMTGWPPELFDDDLSKSFRKKVLRCGRQECHNVLREPWQLECGHRLCMTCLHITRAQPVEDRFCNQCLEDLQYDDAMEEMHESLESMKRKACINFDNGFKDRAVTREVGKLPVICPYRCNQEELKLKEILKHLQQCPQRDVMCVKCSARMKISEFQTHKTSECAYREVPCPFSCSDTLFLYKDLEKHISTCPAVSKLCRLCKRSVSGSLGKHLLEECWAPCPFKCLDGKPVRIIDHLSTEVTSNNHLDLLRSYLLEASGDEADMNADVHVLLGRSLQVEAALDAMKRGLQSPSLYSEMDKTEFDRLLKAALVSYKNRAELDDSETVVAVLATDMENLPPVERYYTDLEMKIRQHEELTADKLRRLATDQQEREAAAEEQKTSLNVLLVPTNRGHFIWKINPVSEQIDMTGSQCITSIPFFSRPFGYQFCLRAYLLGDGDGKGTHLSLYVILMRGEYDALLRWPLQAEVTLKLRNQKKAQQDVVNVINTDSAPVSFSQPQSDSNPGCGFPKFAEQSFLYTEESEFVVDDTMFIEASVKVLTDH